MAAAAVAFNGSVFWPEQLMRVAEEYLFDREMAVSSMGPVGYLPDYNWMRSRNHFNRY